MTDATPGAEGAETVPSTASKVAGFASKLGATFSTQSANDSTALMTFVSHILGKNAKVWIYEDRVEYERKVGVSVGKITAGALTGGMSLLATGIGQGAYGVGKGTNEVIPIKAVTSVTTKRDGFINSVVSIATPAGVIEMRVSRNEAEQAKRILTDLMLRPAQPTVVIQNGPAATAAPSPSDGTAEQITKLADLHKAGILSDEEFAAAKAKALGL